MDIRPNHTALTSQQKKAFTDAVLLLKNNVDSKLNPGHQKRYDDYVQIHKNAMMGPDMFMPMPHGGPLFFPWHRVLLRQFELDLQAAANDNTITVPYWDWNITGSNTPFSNDFLGGDGDSAQSHSVISGPFAFSGGKFEIRVWDDTPGNKALLREFGTEPTSYLPSATDVASVLTRVPYSPGSGSWEKTCEGGLHNPVHRWIGGNMADATSPNDPVFFLHHCYLDLLWERWKLQHPTIEPYLPTTGGNGIDLASKLVFNKTGRPKPWSGTWKVQDTLDTTSLGYQYA
jgi:tyrosinase